MKMPLIVLALLALFLVVQHQDYQEELRSEAAAKEIAQARCAAVNRPAVQDVDGHWTCQDIAPAFAMTDPIAK